MKVKVDFHVHTVYSPDSVINFEDLRDGCRRGGIDAVAIMDHDVIEGAFEYAARSEELLSAGEWAPRVLVGEEVRTTGGEICGLFLRDWVPDHMPPRETMEFIREQGGLVYIPHPFDLLKLKRLKASELVELSELIDIVEEFNGKPRFPPANVLARRFLERHPMAGAAGSDAHDPTRLGAAFVEVEDFTGPEDLMEKLSDGTVSGSMYSPFASAFTRFRIRHSRKKAGS